MSTDGDDGPGQREVAVRLFAAEFEDADLSYAESDEERAPNYVVTPTGARINRLFAVGVLTEVEAVGEDVLRGRVVDPTGAFVVYAGQYQPDAQTALERTDPPEFVAVTGKARTFQPEDSDVVYTSIRPESINTVDAETRDRWTVTTAERTLDRIGVAASALESGLAGEDLAASLRAAGVEEALAAGLPLALDHYGTTGAYLTALRDLSLDAARVVAGEREEVDALSLSPGDGDDGDLASLSSLDLGTQTADEESAVPTAATDGSPQDTRAGSVEADTAGDSVSDPPEASESETDVTAVDNSSDTATETAPTVVEADSEEDIGDFEPGEFDLDEEVREEVESEYGTDFQSGTEVDDPGEADIETPDPESMEAESDETSTATASGTTAETASETIEETEPAAAEATDRESTAPDEDVAIEDAVMDAMEALDDGDGADRAAVIDRVSERAGADADAVEEAIQNALMDGRCYEPDDATLKPI